MAGLGDNPVQFFFPPAPGIGFPGTAGPVLGVTTGYRGQADAKRPQNLKTKVAKTRQLFFSGDCRKYQPRKYSASAGAMGSDDGPRKVNLAWPSFIRTLGAFLFSWNPKLSLVPNETSKIFSTWFLSPEQHAAEMLLYVVLHAYPIFNILAYGVPGWNLPYPQQESSPVMETVDTIVYLAFCGSFLATIYFKYQRDRLWFLFCPCHVFTIICLVVGSSRSPLAAWWFNFYLHQVLHAHPPHTCTHTRTHTRTCTPY
jgi:hypothetical protein